MACLDYRLVNDQALGPQLVSSTDGNWGVGEGGNLPSAVLVALARHANKV